MKTIAHSNIATRFGAICALAIAGALLTSSISSPAFAHKSGGHHGKPSKPQNPGPIGPLPKPMPQPPMPKRPDVVRDHRTPKPVVIRDHRTPKPVVVRDHRAPKVVTPGGGGVKVTSTATVRDHRAQPVVRDQRGKTTTVKVLGQKVVTVTSKGGKRCAAGVCL
jgi:hypothetical protein